MSTLLIHANKVFDISNCPYSSEIGKLFRGQRGALHQNRKRASLLQFTVLTNFVIARVVPKVVGQFAPFATGVLDIGHA